VLPNATPPPGLRERKKQLTRDQLVEAAFTLFDERGYDNVAAAEIAAVAGVSERTFFRYFPAKEDVVFPDAEERLGHMKEVVANLPQDVSLIEGLRQALTVISLEYEESREIQMMRARLVMATPSLQTFIFHREQEWVELFASAIAERLGLDHDQDMRPELTAAVVVAVFRVVMTRWIRSDGDGDIGSSLDEALAFVGTGLAVTGLDDGD
jgi:AcrR family transcriptional regulator